MFKTPGGGTARPSCPKKTHMEEQMANVISQERITPFVMLRSQQAPNPAFRVGPILCPSTTCTQCTHLDQMLARVQPRVLRGAGSHPLGRHHRAAGGERHEQVLRTMKLRTHEVREVVRALRGHRAAQIQHLCVQTKVQQ